MLKQVRLILLALLALLGFGANRAFADGTLVDGLYYILDTGNRVATVTYPGMSVPAAAGDNSYTGDVVVPGSIYYDGTEYTVTTIGEGAFKYASLNSLTISEGVTSIAGSVFNNATIATWMKIPSTVTTISGAGDNGSGSKCPVIYIGSQEKGSQLTAVNGSFMYSADVTDVYLYGQTPAKSMGAYAFSKAPKFHVYENLLSTYQTCSWAKDGWSRSRNFVGDIEVLYTYEDVTKSVAIYEAYGVKEGTNPGTFPAGTTEAFQNALNVAKAITENSSASEMRQACKNLDAEYENLKKVATNPITEGYYYLVNNYEAYNKKFGAYPAIYTTPDFKRSSGASACLYDKFDATNANYIYKVTPKEGKADYFDVQNVATGWYLNTGDGNDWYGEVTTCSETATNAQWFRSYSMGSGIFWVADETDTNVSRAISGAGNLRQRNFVFGWTTYTDVVGDDLKGYNTWSLIPVSADSVATLVEKAIQEKTIKAEVLTDLEPLYTSLTATATAVAAKDAPYDKVAENILTAFTEAYNNAKTLVSIKNYNQTTPADTYSKVLQNLKTAKANLINATPATLEDGYYYIVNASTTFQEKQNKTMAMYIDVTGEPIKWKEFNRANEDFVFELKQQESGNYYIKGSSTGAYFGTTETDNTYSIPVYSSETPIEQIILHYENYSENAYRIHNVKNSWDWHPLGNQNGAGSGGSLVGWPAYLSDASTWYFVKVTDEDWAAINQRKITEELKNAINEASLTLGNNLTYEKSNALIKSDASNLSTNAKSLELAKLVNGNLNDRTETWSQYPSSDAYLQVDFGGFPDLQPSEIYLTIAPRNDSYYKQDVPKSWIITGSNDGENWNYIGEYATNPDSIAIGKAYTYPLIYLGQAYRYVRFTSPVALDNRTGINTHFALSEFQVYGTGNSSNELDEDVLDALEALNDSINAARVKINANNATEEDVANIVAQNQKVLATIEEAKIPGGVWEIATEPSEPEDEKAYVIKSVNKGLYVTAKGASKQFSTLNNDAVWGITATGEQTEDQNPLYVLTPATNPETFWQAEDFTDGATEGSPWDGYDTHKYAGLNAYFGDYETAQKFTILPATAFSEDQTRSSIGKNQTPKGYVVATADKVTSGTFSKYYKLDTQGGDVALDPYVADADWLFYEATFNSDIKAELAEALKVYNFDTANAPTGTDPGFYNADNFAAYTAALTAAQAIDENSSKNDIRKAIDDLASAYAKAIEINPIVEGYYTIVSAGKGSGYPFSDTEKYDDEDRFALYNSNGVVNWKTYDESAYEEIYYLSSSADGGWYAKSLVDNTYINKGTGKYNCQVTTSVDAATSQEFVASAVVGKFIAKFNGNPYAYALSPSHNGATDKTEGTLNIWGSTDEANKGKMNLWYLHKVSDETVAKAQESILAGLNDLIAEIEGKNFEGSTLPGYYSVANVDSLNKTLAKAKNLGESTTEEKLAVLNELKSIYAATITKLNPIVEGYYYIVNKCDAYKQKFSQPAAMYVSGEKISDDDESLSSVRFETFDENNAYFIFKLTPKEGVENGFDAYSPYTERYLNTGNGNNWYGEDLTASTTAKNAQLFKNYGLGQYWIADETDTRVSRCIRISSNQAKNGRIFGWTQLADQIPADRTGYNAWELIPLTDEAAAQIMQKQEEIDNIVGTKYEELCDYVDDIQATYDSYVDEASELSEEIKTALKQGYKKFTDARSSYPYDITSTAEDYEHIKQNLEELMETAKKEISGVDGIAAGGNSTINATNGGLTVTAEADMTLSIYNASGILVTKQSLKAGETTSVSLTSGVYVVNGKKILVK